jgi:hypothetical protein
MTLDELERLGAVMRGEKVTPTALAYKVLTLDRDLADANARLSRVGKEKWRRDAEVRIERLESQLHAKDAALAFAVRRNQVLRNKVKGRS